MTTNTTMIDWLLAPLQYEFHGPRPAGSRHGGRSFAAYWAPTWCCAEWHFFGDALAHAILPGVAVAYLISGGAEGALFIAALVKGSAQRSASAPSAKAAGSGRIQPSACCLPPCSRWASR